MVDEATLEDLQVTARTAPASVDFRTLCIGIAQDDYHVESRAHDVRDAIVESIDEPEAVLDAIWPLLTDDVDLLAWVVGEEPSA